MKWISILLSLWAAIPLCAKNLAAKQQNSQKELLFVENKGQIRDQYHQPRPDIQYRIAATEGLNIFLGRGTLHYVWAKTIPGAEAGSLLADEPNPQAIPAAALYRVDVSLLGANPHARAISEDAQNYREHYFQPWINTANANSGVTARAYTKITYKEVYPHIDWVFYTNDKGQLEHDFVIRPGGRVQDIRLQYSGATALYLRPDGSLHMQSPMGSITEKAPYSYDEKGKMVPSHYVLEGNTLSFGMAPYSGNLTIDPVLEWGSYFGGAGNEEAFALAADKDGYIYMAGSTASTDNIASTGAHQTSYGLGNSDAYISKWTKEGALLWSSYYGGSNIDVAKGLGCDSLGHIYLGGYTNSAGGIASPGSFQELKKGTANSYDAFVVQFDTSGQRKWASYFGGTNNDAQTSFTLTSTPSGHVILAGNTQSTGLASGAGIHQSSPGGGIDVFLAQYNPDGNLLWCTYYGGTGTEQAYGLAADTAGNIYLSGWTQSTGAIASPGSHQNTLSGGRDAYLAQFTPNGQRTWATYFGGVEIDEARCLAVKGNLVVIGGYSSSSQGITKANAHQPNLYNLADAMLAGFTTEGNQLWGTYYGGSGVEDCILGLAIDDAGYIYASGNAHAADGIASSDGLQPVFGGAYDCFLIKFNPEAQRVWATYYGGSSAEQQGIMTLHKTDIYLAGKTFSASGIATANGHQNLLAGGNDAFLVRIHDCTPPGTLSALSGPEALCAGQTALYSLVADSLAQQYFWQIPGGGQGASDSNSIALQAGTEGGQLQVYARSACGGLSDTQSLDITVWPLPTPEIQENNGVLTAAQTYTGYQWYRDGAEIEGADSAILLPTTSGYYSLEVTDANGCSGQSDSIWVKGLSIDNSWPGTGLSLYPNPVQAILYVRPATAGVLTVNDIAGRTAMQPVPVKPGSLSIPVQALPAGIYIVTFAGEKGHSLFKIVKQ